ncbi:MAG: ATP-dependent zinc metalloprotease FtsH [Actinomycetota bacterium]|nr:ATP-dependent zinc metalloprotease FtsH [Actinomycetota bacterium]
MSPQGSPTPPQRQNKGSGSSGRQESGWPKWSIWILLGLVVAALFLPSQLDRSSSESLAYSDFLDDVEAGEVESFEFNNNNGDITATYSDGEERTTTGPIEFSEADRALFAEQGVEYNFDTPESSFLSALIPLMLPIGVFILFIWWMQRRAAGQMGNIMSIGRSKAKTYSTERPATTFSDVAGYDGVKQEITEIIDFLKTPARFAEIGARIPKGVLLVGPPGTGKTLIARAVAGEAGVPFLSVTGSDFMEMFVGVGASRVRDLFQSARKMGRAIIFIDEIDSIGRKRGAGLGGGHDEREQTLNQMLSEMDGFEAAEGVVIIAATNRPDVLDPALLRPGRFDRQVVVPLPEINERRSILETHCKSKRVDPNVDLNVVARSTPGMAGADLANMVNEAALIAVRQGDDTIRTNHFEEARDRVLIGQKRESVMMTDKEKEVTAYHETGHALTAAVLPHADPVHKVTILPAGMALGVTMQLPEERHHYTQHYFEDRLAVMMGGRMAEELIYGVTSAGAANDLLQATELARKMVREFGMSERVGPMAWGGGGQVFLGEDMVHNARDYSDETARVVDEEIEQILRAAELRCRQTLHENRRALEMISRSLLEHETIDGSEVYRLIEVARSTASAPSEPAVGAFDHGQSNGS